MRHKCIASFVLFLICAVSVAAYASGRVERGGIVRVTAAKQGILIKNFNPFSPKLLHPTLGCFYEPLVFANAYKGEVSPWLAKSYGWSKDLKTITFQLHDHVRWSDGKPFTADDVLFTLMLAKENRALDREGIWKKGLANVKKLGRHSVSFTFETVNTTILPSLGGIYIVPQHIWQSVENPSTWTGNENPVGTGPFLFDAGSFTEQSYRLKRNPNYWQLGRDGRPLPYIDGIQYIGATGNSQLAMKVVSGQVDWGNVFMANIDRLFVSRDPIHHHYWLPEGNLVYLNLNNGKAPFDNINVRRAVAMAIDQREITTIMASGALPAELSGVTSGYRHWVSEKAKRYLPAYDPAAGRRLLEQAGYRENADGIYEKEGVTLSFDLYVPTGWTDWVTAMDVVGTQLSKISVEARVMQVAWPSPFLTNITKGDYQISVDYVSSGFSPYHQYNFILPERHWAPVGEDASGHSQVRYRNAEVDRAFAAFSRTDKTDERLKEMDIVLTAVLRDTPLIPLFFNPTWFQYSTKRFVGWPSRDDSYTAPRTWGMAKIPVLLNLRPVR